MGYSIALASPRFIFNDPERFFHSYAFPLLSHTREMLVSIWNMPSYGRRLKYLEKNGLEFDITLKSLGHSKKLKAEALVNLNGCHWPSYEVKATRNTDITKVHHLMDYNFEPVNFADKLASSGTNYLLGYADHGKYCNFYKMYFGQLNLPLLAVPFGVSPRYTCGETDKLLRINKLLGVGALNPIDDPLAPANSLVEFTNYFSSKFSHRFRAEFRQSATQYSMLKDFFPRPPKTKDSNLDIPSLLKKYQFFLNDPSVLQFPPARTYEGVACGSIMVAPDNLCFRDIGFSHLNNCIFFSPSDPKWIQNTLALLENINDNDKARIQKNGINWVQNYTGKKLASNLISELHNAST
jgi:hypothetical protein